ncbi:7222_t:CDS:2 [Entrophospora sp. SA101]|nr:9118_t:CDS:2 [Entrophospora sp. SA101]CAJ0862864.1 7222_t:CDS:2 [Entrophospora sp. SA101]
MSLVSNAQSYGQNETLISSIRNIIKASDDAGATRFRIIIDSRSHPTNSLLSSGMKAWQGPAILIFNNSKFEKSDFENLMKIREKFLPMKNERGMICTLPKEGIRGFHERDQLAPFIGIEGINVRSTFFNGVLFRIPLRQQKSEISDKVFTIDEVLRLFRNIKSNFASYFLFLRNIEEIEVSHIPKTTSSPHATSLWKATVNGLDENVRNKRKRAVNGEIQIFQMKIKLIDDSKDKQNDKWIIAIGAQEDPEDPDLKAYANQHRLRVLGGVATLLESDQEKEKNQNYFIRRITSFKSLKNDLGNQYYFEEGTLLRSIEKGREEDKDQNDFEGRMFSFLPLPDTTCLPVHLNGTWAQSSDRARLLLEKDNDLPDLDHQKLEWNRHILLEFLPEVYCRLLEEILILQNSNQIDLKNRCISKFWPFPSVTQNYPKYIISYGCKVLQRILQHDNISRLITPVYYYSHNDKVTFTNENVQVDNLFRCLSYSRIEAFRHLLRNNWKELKVLGYYFEKKLFFVIKLEISNCKILRNLDVPVRGIQSYTFEDVEFPEESDDSYVDFLDSVLSYGCENLVENLKDRDCFPCAFTSDLKRISDLYDYSNVVFRCVFGGDSNNFLDLRLSKYAKKLANIGFNKEIDQDSFTKCAEKVEELLGMDDPPSDIRYRGFILVDHLYKNIDEFEFKGIDRIPFVPIVKCLDKHYNKHYNHTRVLDCLNNVIHPEYKEVAWSQKPLIAEDVIPPDNVLRKYPSFGKPDVLTVIKHLRLLHTKLIKDEEWRNWKETFLFNVFKVYKWLDKKCSNESLRLRQYINSNELLFLNCNDDQDPFDTKNWAPVANLILNTEPGERNYVNPRLAKYHKMLKSAGVQEIRLPSFKIQIGENDQTSINRAMLGFLLKQENCFHDVVFVVKNEKIWASRYVLAASSTVFYQKFNSEDLSTVNPARITIDNVSPNSVHIWLRYLYGQNINDAIWNHQSLNKKQPSNLELYKDLLKLANDYKIDHLKNLMELKLSLLVNRSSVREIETLARELNANQLEEYCHCFIRDNMNLYTVI